MAHLHIRKKYHSFDEENNPFHDHHNHHNNHHHHHHEMIQETTIMHSSPGSGDHSNNNHNRLLTMRRTESIDPQNKNKTKQRKKEMKFAIGIVSMFLLIGFILVFFLLQHQHRKVILHAIRNPWAHGGAALRMAATHGKRHNAAGFHHHFYSGSPRFVTVVMPSVVNPNGRKKRLNAIHDTWGPYARAIYVLHNITEFPKAKHLTISKDSTPTDQYSYPQNLLLPEEIDFEQGVPRLFHTIETIYKRVNPDFAFFVNDHTYVIASHLCHYLDDKDPNIDMYAGHALRNDKVLFNSGAAGYVLSRETMKKIITKFDEHDPNCYLDENSPKKDWLQGNPGLVTVECLSSMGIRAIDTRANENNNNNKLHRFHAFPIIRLISSNVDGWYIKKHNINDLSDEWINNQNNNNNFDETYNNLLLGIDCCSSDTISFHYVEYKECYALFHIRHALLLNEHMSDIELKELIINEWPNEQKDIGGYSRGLPKKNDNTEVWTNLLKVIRRISTKETICDC